MKQQFDPYKRSYSSLSMKDLLEARDTFHIHLDHLDNVSATAVGLFRIRRDDTDARAPILATEARHAHGKLGPRQLDNTVTRLGHGRAFWLLSITG